MAYIVDLTLVMQILFCRVSQDNLKISRTLVKRVWGLYESSDLKGYIHSEIARYVRDCGVLNIARPDAAMDKIVDLINETRISSEQLIQLEDSIRVFAPSPDDEEW